MTKEKIRQVYFIGSIGGPIKIGVSDCPARRLVQIQTGCPHKVHLLAATAGDESAERHLHHRFSSARLGGEWFAPVPELVAMIWEIAGKSGEFVLPTKEADADVSEFYPLVETGAAALRILLKRDVPSVSARDAKRIAGVIAREAQRQRQEARDKWLAQRTPADDMRLEGFLRATIETLGDCKVAA